MRYVGLTGLAILYWANVVLLRLVLTHHCTPAKIDADVLAAGTAAPVPARTRVLRPTRESVGDFKCGLPIHDEVLHPAPSTRRRPRVPADGNPLSKLAVVASMNEVRPRIHDCYVEHNVPGTAIVNVVIAKNGKVTSAVVTGRFAESPTGACVERAVRTARFPRSDGLSTPYPFQLH